MLLLRLLVKTSELAGRELFVPRYAGTSAYNALPATDADVCCLSPPMAFLRARWLDEHAKRWTSVAYLGASWVVIFFGHHRTWYPTWTIRHHRAHTAVRGHRRTSLVFASCNRLPAASMPHAAACRYAASRRCPHFRSWRTCRRSPELVFANLQRCSRSKPMTDRDAGSMIITYDLSAADRSS